MKRFLFDPIWFVEYQKKLLWLLNKPLVKIWFRWILRIRSFDCPLSKKIIGLLPNSFIMEPTWKRKKWINTPRRLVLYDKTIRLHRRLIKKYGYKMPLTPWFTQDFRTHNKYSKRLFYAFYPIWYLFHCWDILFANNFKPAWNLGYDDLTVYPDPDTEITSVDGWARRHNVDEAWATIRAGAGTQAFDTDEGNQSPQMAASETTNRWGELRRSIFLFDTSSLPDNAVISGAIFSQYGYAKGDTLNVTPAIAMVGSNPASNTALAAADYNTVNTTRQADTDVTYAGWSITGYNAWTLNATGLGNISKTGITKFGTAFAKDVDNSAPTWSSANSANVGGYFAERTGTTSDPKLVVTYTVVSGPANLKTFNGLAKASVKTINSLAIASIKSWNGLT